MLPRQARRTFRKPFTKPFTKPFSQPDAPDCNRLHDKSVNKRAPATPNEMVMIMTHEVTNGNLYKSKSTFNMYSTLLMLFAVDGLFAFRVGSLDEDCVEAGGRGGGEDEPGRAAHEVAAASLHDLHDLRDLAH